MSVVTRIPSKSAVLNPTARFKATYNTPVLGKYSFTREGMNVTRRNRNVEMIELKRQSLYLVTNWRFETTVATDLYQQGIADNAIPQVALQLRDQSKTLIFSTPIEIPAEIGNSGIATTQWFTVDQPDVLVASFKGELDQVGDLINFPEINATFSITLYQISDPRWVRKYLARTEDPQDGIAI